MKTIALMIAIGLAVGILFIQFSEIYKRYKNRKHGMPKWNNPPPVPPKKQKQS